MNSSRKGSRAGIVLMTSIATAVLTLLIAWAAARHLGWITTARQEAPGGDSAGVRRILYYRNPMDPTITSPVPAKDYMGMDYIPVYEGGEEPSGSDQEAEDFFAEERGAPGLAEVRLGPQELALAGIQTAVASRGTLHRTVRTVGLVVPDETRISRVQTRVEGWVERLHVNFTGQKVRAGEPVMDLYSPELLASQEEYLRARQTAGQMAQVSPEAMATADRLLSAARERLLLFEFPRQALQELDRRGQATRAVTLRAPAGGHVTAKAIYEGQRVEPGQELYTLVDLSRIWIEADLYEAESRDVSLGQEATLSLPYLPGSVLSGQVAFIYPVLDPVARTLKVRFEFQNPTLALRPGMFVDVALDLQKGEGILVPASAVVDTGLRQVVYVSRGGGRFVPRLVSIGVRGQDQVQILEGVGEGERVVTRANFLVDSESRMQGAIAPAPSAAPGGSSP